MPIAWTESLTLRLVTFYGEHECLRNPLHPDFKNKLCRNEAYKEIVDSMNVCGLTVYDCIKMITYIKSQYCYELAKISTAISCEKFYEPTASWFPTVHQLFFPFVTTYSHTNNFCKVCDDGRGTFKDYHCNEAHDQSTRTDSGGLKVLNGGCDCPYAICYCDKTYTLKPRTRLKKPEKPFFTQAEGEEIAALQTTTTDRKNYSHSRPQRIIRINARNNTRRSINAEHATQTEVSYFKTACTACQACMENETPLNTANLATLPMKSDPKDNNCVDGVPTEEDIKEKRKLDEFDMFGKSIAFQLRNISFETAIKLEKRIQDLIVRERLDILKSKRLDCCTDSSCSECTVLHKEMICSCGLPVIMIKAETSSDFETKQRI